MATATCADSSRIAVVNTSARALVSASACTRSFIRASPSSASLDICPILRLSPEFRSRCRRSSEGRPDPPHPVNSSTALAVFPHDDYKAHAIAQEEPRAVFDAGQVGKLVTPKGLCCQFSTRPELIGGEVHLKTQGSTSVATRVNLARARSMGPADSRAEPTAQDLSWPLTVRRSVADVVGSAFAEGRACCHGAACRSRVEPAHQLSS